MWSGSPASKVRVNAKENAEEVVVEVQGCQDQALSSPGPLQLPKKHPRFSACRVTHYGAYSLELNQG